jgi:Protein of unknown function (DUF1593)
MKTVTPFGLGLLLALSASLPTQAGQAKHRLLVLTDIENEPDDSQSLVRLLTYANDLDIEGLVATTSTHLRDRVAPETIHKTIDAYGNVQDNLLKHDRGYPTAWALHSKVKQGVPLYGMQGVGEGHDSEGSEWIIQALEKADDRPLWVSVWGGPNTLAQALWNIRKTKTPDEAEALYRKLRVYTISDQDDSGPWIRKTFPGIFYIVSPGGHNSYLRATWASITRSMPGANNEVVSKEWIARNIQQGHGPLGARYPDVAYGMEGDTPSYLGLIPNGLSEPEHPDWGGWGGRYELSTPEGEKRPIWTNADDTYRPGSMMRILGPGTDSTEYKGNQVTLWRWREEFQNDFAARMDWTVKSYDEANHPPVPVLAHPGSFTVRAGDQFKLEADGTYDPDGDSLSYFWFQYPEAGTFRDTIRFGFAPNIYNVSTVIAPEVESPQTVHFILKVTDKGTPPLTRYARVIVTIVPK